MMTQREIQHLYWRATFAPPLAISTKLSRDEHFNRLLKDAEDWKELDVMGEQVLPKRSELMDLSQEERKMLRKSLKARMRDLNRYWLMEMVQTKGQLREKMALFWHDHFACRPRQAHIGQKYLNTIRKHALGNFREILHAIAKDPGMLEFLNSAQNKKRSPNENFARELLELFTLGRGHYTENDIKEAARAFTGWGHDKVGNYVFRKFQHDEGQKAFMGKKGNFGGEDIINMLLENRQTARYITHKLYQFLVNEEVDEQQVDKWGKLFFEANYDIPTLLRAIFTSPHFYQKKHIGSKIKSPIAFLVGMMRMLEIEFQKENTLTLLQKGLGQMLLFPPNVAGWPQGKAWIDSSSIMLRLRLPRIIIFATALDLDLTEAASMNEGISLPKQEWRKLQRKLEASMNWKALNKSFSKLPRNERIAQMRQFILQSDPQLLPDSFFAQRIPPNISTSEEIKHICMNLMSTPEYQVC